MAAERVDHWVATRSQISYSGKNPLIYGASPGPRLRWTRSGPGAPTRVAVPAGVTRARARSRSRATAETLSISLLQRGEDNMRSR